MGTIGFEDSFSLLGAILNHDVSKIINTINNLNSKGVDFRICVQDFRRFMLNAVKTMLNVDLNLIPMPVTEIEKFKQYPQDQRLFLILARVNELVPKMTYDADPFTLVTTEFIRMAGEI